MSAVTILSLTVGVLAVALVAALWVLVAAVNAARLTHLVNLAETERRQEAEHLLRAEREHIVSLETYLPGEPNEGLYVYTGGV